MMEELEKEIRRRCRKRTGSSDIGSYEEEEEALPKEEFDEIAEEELPFQDILAEKRRNYAAKEEFVYLLYNDNLLNFVNAWNGTFLRKRPRKKDLDDSVSTEVQFKEEDTVEDELSRILKAETDLEEQTESEEPWKLIQHDEHAEMQFVNNNTYEGRISRKMMEGEGLYKWNNGVQYKGEFEANQIEGNGLLEWSDTCWYEGEFVNGYRHGRGTVVDKDYNRFYIGYWHMGQKHGKGYCRYGENNSYDGDWVMGKRQGVGYRIYANDVRYIGEWENDVRHGVGTMAWPNGDVYRGNWKNGEMHSYGEYIWKTFFNKTLTWPQESSYVGQWQKGMRYGGGVLRLNSIAGARYSGDWKCDKMHGYGVIIGNNGEITEGDPLFLKDILEPEKNMSTVLPEGTCKTENSEDSCADGEIPQFPFGKKPSKLFDACKTAVARPEQLLSIWYHISRLLEPETLKESSVYSIPSEKCHVCEEESSCSCLRIKESIENGQKLSEGSGNRHTSEMYRSSYISSKIINMKNEIKSTDETRKDSTLQISASSDAENDTLLSACHLEEKWLYNCIKMHMTHIRQIYNKYASLFSDNPPNCVLTMSRMSLWQLWRDCGIHKRGFSLVQIDIYLATNKSVFVEDAHYPFERLEIWQFLHALLEVAWHLYTKHADIDTSKIRGKLGSGLHKFLEIDIYPNVENHVGLLSRGYVDTVSIFSVYQLYLEIGYPPSVKEILQSMCPPKELRENLPTGELATSMPAYLLDGFNCVTVGERISYLPKHEEPFTQKQSDMHIQHDSIIDYGLHGFHIVGPVALLEVIANVCPLIKDTDTNLIINVDYKVTVLEFYEILLEATTLLFHRKSTEVEPAFNVIDGGDELPKTDVVQQTKLARLSPRKGGKSKKK